MVYERGIAYGGSFLDPGYDIRIDSLDFLHPMNRIILFLQRCLPVLLFNGLRTKIGDSVK